MKRILFFVVAVGFLLQAETTISTTIDPNVMFYDNSTGNIKKDRKKVLKNMVNLEKERVKGFNQYSETKMSKGDLSAFGAFFKGSLESCVKQGICYYEHKDGKVSFVVNDREKFYQHVLKDLGTELSLPLFNWLYKGSDFGALHEQFGDMYDGYIKYLISMVRVSQKEKTRKVDAVALKKMEDQAKKETQTAFKKRGDGEFEHHDNNDSPDFIGAKKIGNHSADINHSPSGAALPSSANATKETTSSNSTAYSKKKKKRKKRSRENAEQQALQQELEKHTSMEGKTKSDTSRKSEKEKGYTK
ncbi:hypothetical protein [Helicobacter cetorum]|uniref:Uncharacterized protein n=1 Tax=Helicobacter cetorum (strain ATCC BAA-540 / CCUG 52418 / MIT 99-5656) TaxID=1163745 RepID=I0ERW8_HELCM|nr:hypothetical protein [Helicobacter cetorum]AFI05687.1 hypothetical protein HCD_03355 [Helicobacter cetorum MIT 99-5656]